MNNVFVIVLLKVQLLFVSLKNTRKQVLFTYRLVLAQPCMNTVFMRGKHTLGLVNSA